MYSTHHPDFYNQLIDSRFPDKPEMEGARKEISNDLYIDLQCAFHNPDHLNLRNFQKYPIEEILVYLRQTHKLYLSKSLNKISESIEYLTNTDDKFIPLQISLHNFFKGFRKDLEEHIEEEEQHLFPYIEALLAANSATNQTSDFNWKQKVQVVNFLMHHNDSHEKDLQQLTVALQESKSFQDSFAFKMLVNHLSIFELDLRIHAKMEEEVLLARAIDLEKSVLGGNI